MKKALKITCCLGIFGAGVIFGKQIQKSSHKKRTKYAGTLQVYEVDDAIDLYLDLDIPPQNFKNAADVIFTVNKIK
ncbi:MAG: hypothetical protein ACNA7U_01270 [Candidatus Izemoplasmataceae bacterium]